MARWCLSPVGRKDENVSAHNWEFKNGGGLAARSPFFVFLGILPGGMVLNKKFALPKSTRLGSNRDFQKVYQDGRSIAGRYLVLYWRKNEKDQAMVGFAAGKKLGPAVIRNRLKRIMREAWRLHPEKRPTGYDLILVARKSLVGKTFFEAEKGMMEVLQRSNLIPKGEE